MFIFLDKIHTIFANNIPIELTPKWEDLNTCSDLFQIYRFRALQRLDLEEILHNCKIVTKDYLWKVDFVLVFIPEAEQIQKVDALKAAIPGVAIIKVTPERKILDKSSIEKEQAPRAESLRRRRRSHGCRRKRIPKEGQKQKQEQGQQQRPKEKTLPFSFKRIILLSFDSWSTEILTHHVSTDGPKLPNERNTIYSGQPNKKRASNS